jgi:hypothetical protein
MAHIEYDFSGMKYPIDKIPEAQLFSRLPLLKTIFAETSEMCEDKKWQDYISSEQLMRYIVYVYHRKSPLTEIADIIIRKKTALELVGIDLRTSDKIVESKTLFSAIILAHHEFTGYLALNFLKFENNLKWTQLVRVMEAWEDAMYQMQQDPEGTDKKSAVEIAEKKTALYKGSQMYRTDIDRLSAELMQEDMALQNVLSSHLFIEKRRRRLLTPEDYASLTPDERVQEFKERGLLN